MVLPLPPPTLPIGIHGALANCQENQTKRSGGGGVGGGGDLLWMSIPLLQGEVAIFPIPSCYANREKLRQYKLVSLSVELTFF